MMYNNVEDRGSERPNPVLRGPQMSASAALAAFQRLLEKRRESLADARGSETVQAFAGI
jgi:hypothetical protein